MTAEETALSNNEDRERSKERDRNRRSERTSRLNSDNRDRSREKDNRGNRKVADKRIYVSNIPYDYRWQDLKDLFRTEVGKVTHVELFTDENDKPRGCGIVEFEDPESVKQAVEKMHRFDIKGRKLVVKEDYDVERDKYGRLATNRNSDRNRSGGGGGGGSGGGDDNRFREPQGRSNQGRGQSISLSTGGSTLGGSTSSDKFGNTYGLSTQFLESLGINGPLVTRVFVANLDYKVDEKKLLEVFKLAGKVLHVELGRDKDGKSRGFGVIEYDHPVESVQAISMLHNQQLYDRRMTVRLDRANEPDMPPKLPEGLKGLGMGLGAGGNRLTDVARNIPSIQPNNPPPQVVNSITTPSVLANSAFGGALNNVVPAQLASALSGNSAAALQATLASGLGANLATSSLLNSSLTNDLASNLTQLGAGLNASSLSTLQAALANANQNSNNSLLAASRLSKIENDTFGGNNTFGGSTLGSGRDLDLGSFNRRDNDIAGAAFSTNTASIASRQAANNGRHNSDTIILNNLPPNTTWQMLRDKCQDIGDVKFAEMRGSDVGMVRFASEWDAERAVSMMNRSRVDGRTIDVRLY